MEKLRNNLLFSKIAMALLIASGFALGDERKFLEHYDFIAIVQCDPSKDLIHVIEIIKSGPNVRVAWDVKRDFGDMLFDPAAKALPLRHTKCVIYGNKNKKLTSGIAWIKSDDRFEIAELRLSANVLSKLAKENVAGVNKSGYRGQP